MDLAVDRHYDPRMTTLSHKVDCVNSAVADQLSNGPCVNKLLEHTFTGGCPFEFHQYVDDYRGGDCIRNDAMVRKAAEKIVDTE